MTTTASATAIVAREDRPTASVRQSLIAFIDTVLDSLASIVAGADDGEASVTSAAPSRAAIAGNPDPRITRLLNFPTHHS